MQEEYRLTLDGSVLDVVHAQTVGQSAISRFEGEVGQVREALLGGSHEVHRTILAGGWRLRVQPAGLPRWVTATATWP